MKKILALLALTLLLTSCDALTGKEIGRLKINQVSTEGNLHEKEVTLDLKKGAELKIWSDMDIAYEGDVELQFQLAILKNGKKIDGYDIDPVKKNITIKEFKKVINGKTDWSFSGKNGEIKIEEDGKYTFKGIFITSKNTSLKITKAELVFKE